MAQVIIKPGTDIPALKKALKKRGYVLRVQKQVVGPPKYFLHRNPYRELSVEDDRLLIEEVI